MRRYETSGRMAVRFFREYEPDPQKGRTTSSGTSQCGKRPSDLPSAEVFEVQKKVCRRRKRQEKGSGRPVAKLERKKEGERELARIAAKKGGPLLSCNVLRKKSCTSCKKGGKNT